MRNLTTNLALLMEWARVTPKELNRALGIDPSLISRWRTGSRRLPAGSRWCGRLTEYFLQVRRDEVTALMARVSPLGLSQGQPAEELLERWLGESMGSWEDRDALLDSLQHAGCVEVSEPAEYLDDENYAALLHRETAAVAEARSSLTELQHAIDVMQQYAPQKGGLFTPRAQMAAADLLDGVADPRIRRGAARG